MRIWNLMILSFVQFFSGILDTPIFATQIGDDDNRVIVLSSRCSPAREYPYVVEQEEKPFYKISFNGTSIPILFFKDKDKKIVPGNGKLIIFPFISYRPNAYQLESNTLQMLKHWIETQTDPAFYSVSYKGKPLNFFMLPTVHTLPFEALHSDLRSIIYAIAHTKGSQLITEVSDDVYDNDDLHPFPDDPRCQLNVEKCVQRDLEWFVKTCGDIYEDNPIRWSQRQEEETASCRMIYKNGWTKSLDVESQEALKFIIAEYELIPDFFDKLDPYYVYKRLLSTVSDIQIAGKTHVCLALDHCIEEIFARFNRPIIGLESDDDRIEAKRTEALESLSTCDFSFTFLKISIEQGLKEILQAFERYEPKEGMIIRPTLSDLEFSNSLTMSYLKGHLPKISCGVYADVRTKKWWNTKIAPLLEERGKTVDCRVLLPDLLFPNLMIFGAGHNKGPFAINALIEQKAGYSVHRLTRNELRQLSKILSTKGSKNCQQ
jgi:hypothetical protein